MHSLAISEQGVALRAEGDSLVVVRGERTVRRVRAAELDQVLVFGHVELSCGALALLLRRGVDVVLLTQRGTYRGRVVGRLSKNVSLRMQQYARAGDPEFSLTVARAIVEAKVRHQRQLLLRAQRRLRDDSLAAALGNLRVLAARAAAAPSLDVLRGLEGQAAALYFAHFGLMIRNDQFAFAGRTRRPPRDPVNAMLSFGYAVLGSVLESIVYQAGLDPMLGFFHQPAYGRPSLMLDLLEPFRPMVDQLVLRLVNRRQVGPRDFDRCGEQQLTQMLAADGGPGPEAAPREGLGGRPAGGDQRGEPEAAPFDADPEPGVSGHREQGGEQGAVYLNDTGRRIFLNELFRRLRERMYYPPREGALELRDILTEQAYHLARVVEGREAAYRPFTPW